MQGTILYMEIFAGQKFARTAAMQKFDEMFILYVILEKLV
jgi:hypothetical protein